MGMASWVRVVGVGSCEVVLSNEEARRFYKARVELKVSIILCHNHNNYAQN